MTVIEEPSVVVRRRGRLGHLELNRPHAINALDHTMVRLLSAALAAWADDPTVETVLLTGRGDRGLCAGGDLRLFHGSATSGDLGATTDFLADEYRLDHAVSTYPKPFVAVMDGLVLGGGIGVSGHASHRVVTERSAIGMPETGIGFIPDVGGCWLFAHAPGELGTHLALTGGQVGAGDAIELGLADHHVPSERIDELVAALADGGADEAIATVAAPAPESPLLAAAWIDECYAGDDPAAILARLRAHPDPAAQAAGELLASRSPTAVTAALWAVRAAATMPALADVLAQDLRLTVRFLDEPDLAEGIRAQVIDKDRSPRWSPARLEDVDPEHVRSLFAPLGDRELWL